MKFLHTICITLILTFLFSGCFINKEKQALINGSKVINAIKIDDTTKLEETLKLDCNLHISDNLHPLIIAARYNSKNCFKKLMKNDSIANDSILNNLTFYAIGSDNIELLEVLLESGVDPNIKDEQGLFLINYALGKENLKIFDMLIQKGASVADNNEKGISNLFYAIKNKHVSIYDKLLECCHVYESDPYKSPTHLVIKGKDLELFKKMYSKDSSLKTNKNSLLGYAAKSNAPEIVEFLLKEKADPNYNYFYSVTNFDNALNSGNPKIVKMMIKAGGKKSKSEIKKYGSSLLSAVESNNLEAIKYYVKNGLSVNGNGAFSGPPLRLALQERAYPSIKLLLTLGAKPDKSSMIQLFSCRKLDIVKQVMNRGGTKLLNGKDQKEIVKSLLTQGSKEVIQYVLPKLNKRFKWKDDEDGRAAYYFSAYNNSIVGMKHVYRDVKIHPDSACFFKGSPLQASCTYASYETMKFCIEKGGDVNKLDDEGESLLIDVINSGNHDDVEAKYKCVKLLVDNKANVDIGDTEDKETPIMLAAKYGYNKIVRLLLDNNADIFAKDEDGYDIITYVGRRKLDNDLFRKILTLYIEKNKRIPDDKIKFLAEKLREEKHTEMLSILSELVKDSTLYSNKTTNSIDTLEEIKNNIFDYISNSQSSFEIEEKLKTLKEIVKNDKTILVKSELSKKLDEYGYDNYNFVPLSMLKLIEDNSVSLSNDAIKKQMLVAIDLPERNLDIEAFIHFWNKIELDKKDYIERVLEEENSTLINILKVLGENIQEKEQENDEDA